MHPKEGERQTVVKSLWHFGVQLQSLQSSGHQMSQERRFIEASVCLVVLLPSLARVASVVELGDGGGGGVGGGVWGGGRTTKNVLTKVCCLPSFHQILDSRAIALVTIQTIVLSQQLNTSFVLQKLIPYVSNTKCLAARRRR